jgi:S-adenosylmethionine decarboxylase
MRNLMPEIYRQRLIIEGIFDVVVSKEKIVELLGKLTNILEMRPIISPITFSPKHIHHGFAGFLAWEESGVSVYTWIPERFVTVDIYSCKAFKIKKAVDFVKNFFNCDRIVYKEIK